jgi:hypothetical protein
VTKLKLPANSRAAKLLVRLDGSYFDFAARLPPPLSSRAHLRSTYTGNPGDEPFKGVSAMNPGVTCTPWLFWELVQALEDDLILQVAEAGTLVVLASVLLDHLADGQVEQLGETSLLQQKLFQTGISQFRSCFPSDSGFWSNFERLEAEHLSGLAMELEAQTDPGRFTWEGFLDMVPGKFSPIVVTMAAMTEALDRRELLAPIETSIKHLAIASQLLDDMGDWQEDLATGHLTYYLTRLAPLDRWAATEWPGEEELQNRISTEWLDLKYMGKVKQWLDSSEETTRELGCVGWDDYLNGYRELAERHMRYYEAQHLIRIIEPIVGPTRQ